jgi:arsenate reductase
MGQLHFGYLITVCDRAERECPIFPGMGQRLHWSLPDPAAVEGSAEERLEVFRDVRDELEAKVRAWIGEQAATAVRPETSV